MANNEYEVDVNVKPYVDDGRHYLSSRERATNYWQAFYAASSTRFGYIPDSVVEEKEAAKAVAEEQQKETKPIKVKKCYKKNCGGMVVNLIAIVAFIVIAALSYFAIFRHYTYFFASAGAKELVDVIINTDISNMATGDIIMTYAIPGTALLAAGLALFSLLFDIIALAIRGRLDAMGALSLIALISWLASGILMFFGAGVAQDSATIIEYINPLVDYGVTLGYYIVAVLLLIATIGGFCCYTKKKCIND